MHKLVDNVCGLRNLKVTEQVRLHAREQWIIAGLTLVLSSARSWYFVLTLRDDE